MSMNPFSKARRNRTSELERLQDENSKLKQRLKLMEESGTMIEDLTIKVNDQLSQPSTSKEMEGMAIIIFCINIFITGKILRQNSISCCYYMSVPACMYICI